MKYFLSFIAVFFLIKSSYAQTSELLAVESYKLDNGLTVFLNADSTASRVYGAVMVNAGAKHEDPSATGMAHYLEHLLFKGNEDLGTWNYEAEKPHLDKIQSLYDQIAKTESETEKLELQKQINEEALKASEYGLPNEFDKLLRSIGSTGINAFTNYEMTFYHNSFPSHEINKWLDIYSTRFENPIFRSFQSELEVVYEEKNRAMDDMERKVFEETSRFLFPDLPYGEWSVLGKVEHLKSPSLTKMYAFFDKHYVPGNMALILTGNFDSEYVKPLIEEKFGGWEAKPVPELNLPTLDPLPGEVAAKVRITPVKAGFLGYQTPAQNHPDREAIDIVEYLLYNNGQTGFINQLQLNNEMIYAGSFSSVYNSASCFVIFFVPKILIQSINNAQGKVEAAINKIKTGDFSEDQLLSAKNELSINFQSSLEDLDSRGTLIGGAFNAGFTWEEALGYPDRIEKITREEVIAAAQKYFGENRLRMISRTGFGKATKLEKPPFKPVVADQSKSSEYSETFDELPSRPFEPRYLDFEKDVDRAEAKGGHEIIATKNSINNLFSLDIKFKKGLFADPLTEFAAKIAFRSGAGNMSLSELKEAFASIGCNYTFSINGNYTTARLTGKEENLEKGLDLLNVILTDLKPTEKAIKITFNAEFTARKLEKRAPNTMGQIMLNYASFGEDSYYLQRPSEKELKKTEVETLSNLFDEITSEYEAEIVFYGKKTADDIASLIDEKLALSQNPKSNSFQYNDIKEPENKILFIINSKAVQSQIWFHMMSDPVDKDQFSKVEAFNDYFGGGFSGLVTQEIREYRSLAYSTGASFIVPPIEGNKTRLYGYIGCQADKTVDAIKVMSGLLEDMPLKADRISSLQQSLQMKVVTEFPDIQNIPEIILDYERRGYKEDPNKNAFEEYAGLSMEDLNEFYESRIKGKPYMITVYGDKKRINLEKLKALGTVIELSINDVANF